MKTYLIPAFLMRSRVMKSSILLLKVILFSIMIMAPAMIFVACENKYATSETALLEGKWILLNNPSETVTFTSTHIRQSNGSHCQYMVDNGIIYTWTKPFHPLGYAEHPYQLKGDTLYIDKFWFTLTFEYDDVVLIKKKI